MKADTQSHNSASRLIPEAHRICADLTKARPTLYWTDLSLTAFTAYCGLTGTLVSGSFATRFSGGLIATFAIYRGVSFIHEVVHLRKDDVPGFRFGYNLLIGVPFLVPSFLYEGVHNLHHAKSRYGTVADPEYLPLARQTIWHVLAFLAIALLTPVGLLLRFALLGPLSFVSETVRCITGERFSALAINPAFRREAATSAQMRLWRRLDTLCSVWALVFVSGVALGVVSLQAFFAIMLVGAGVGTVNQIRTLVAHHWENEGEEMSAEEQFLDSVTVPPPATLPMLWAPVGLRYHALHHLLPRVPYHNLGAAHARLCRLLPADSAYHQASSSGFWPVLRRLLHGLRNRTSPTAAE